jgi:hypothetical protein
MLLFENGPDERHLQVPRICHLGALIGDRANQTSVELIIPKREEARSRGVRVTV